MTTIQSKGAVAAALMLSGVGMASLFAQHGSAEEPLLSGNPRTAVLKPASSPYIDAHVHIDQHDPEGAIQLLLRAMDTLARDDHGMARVGAAVEADDRAVCGGEHVNDLALAVIAPLEADNGCARRSG